ncbi:MAG: nucleoside hydrolase [Nocardioidaceae bacterium]
MVLVHVDTDLGDNPDDACAVAMLLGWPGVELRSISTVNDRDGHRAALVRELLELAGAADVPVAAEPSAPSELVSAAEDDAALLALGPLTNVAGADALKPGVLADVDLTICGGWLDGPGPGLPAWDARRDSNVQADPTAARLVWERCDATWVPVAASCVATLRETDLRRLAAAGPLGRRLAGDSLAHGRSRGHHELGRECGRLPADLVTFHFDPVAAATAVGWQGARIEQVEVTWVAGEPGARMARPHQRSRVEDHLSTRRTSVVTVVDGDAFGQVWLGAVEAAARRAAS